MKKSLFAVVALVVATSASAEGNYASTKLETRDGRDGAHDSNALALTVGKKINQHLSAEIYTRVKRENDTDKNNTRLEGALIGSAETPINGLSVYTRGAIGDKFSGTTDYGYWSIEPGIKYSVTDTTSVKAGLRLRDAFNTDNNDSTRTYKLSGEYALNKKESISLSYDRSYGDSKYNAIGIGYSIKFN